jgi:hemerythrin-like domain-containing protein
VAVNPHIDMNTIIHDALRRDLDRLDVVLRSPTADERRTALRDHVGWMLDVLHHHHVGEDDGVWPRVLAKRPDLQGMVDEMEAEHEALAAASDGLRAAAADYRASGSDANRETMAAALTHMKQATLPHLEHEEREAMPLVLDTLDDADWAYLEKNHFRKGMSFTDTGLYGMWLLDGLDERRQQVVRSAIPGPVLWIMQRLFGPRYRRTSALAWGAT